MLVSALKCVSLLSCSLTKDTKRTTGKGDWGSETELGFSLTFRYVFDIIWFGKTHSPVLFVYCIFHNLALQKVVGM